eukprot:scaffold18138_cov128-Cylindrotheca_fusiformis.AAC.19
MKGNDGSAARKRMLHRLVVGGGICLCFSAILLVRTGSKWLFGQDSSSSARNLLRDHSGRNDYMMETATHKMMDKAHRFRKELHKDYNKHKFHEPEMLEKILEAEINLVDLEVIEEEMLRSHPSSYAGVYGHFCQLNFAVHKEDPAADDSGGDD